MPPILHRYIRLISLALSVATLNTPLISGATPLYARQTGTQCIACHTGGQFPELTTFGRQFKLLGYTLGTRVDIPLAGMLQGGFTSIRNHSGSADPGTDFAHDNSMQLQQASVFSGGKIVENVGAFIQWTYNGIKHHSQIDNVDLRFADVTAIAGKRMIYGVSLNNNPSVQDVWNTTPAWRFPTAGPGGAFQGYGPNTMVDGTLAQSVVGASAYVDWNNLLYVELSGYKTADRAFSFMRAGGDTVNNRFPVKGTNPYWRLALHGDTGAHSWMVGTYGMSADAYSDPTNASSPTNRFRDNAVDGQYQYSNGPHQVSAQATRIHEVINWNAGAIFGGQVSNSKDTLHTTRIKGSYFYNSKVGATIAYFSTTGSQDALLYSNNTSLTPDTSGHILELSYLPTEKIRMALQYTMYGKLNGSKSGYDSSGALPGRNARDNDTWFLSTWFLF